MRVYWKALIGYGLVFWALLCITDFLGVTNVHKYSKELDELYEKPEVIQKLENRLEPHLGHLRYKGIKFGWSLLVWNTVTFVISIVVCSIGRTITWACWNVYRYYKNKIAIIYMSSSANQYSGSVTSLSRIPVIVKSISKSTDCISTNNSKSSKIETEKSCPNLLKRSNSNLSIFTDVNSKTCRTLFRKDIYMTDNASLSKEKCLERQCNKLKEELHFLQLSSMKEYAIISRKFALATKEKNDLNKQLKVALKENKAAKQQLEELVQEKAALLRKLETATREFKCNTKTKKFALARLEEVTNNVDELRQQLEQVTIDKEILERKLKVLETEYNKLHERYLTSQERLASNSSQEDHLPVRDENVQKHNYNLEKYNPNCLDQNRIPANVQKTADVLASVSQTELDMTKIQEKIKQLERNLENLNVRDNEFGSSNGFDQLESELSVSANTNTTDSQNRLDDESADFSSGNSPRPRYWPERVVDLIGRNKQHIAKIQALTTKIQEKARFLGNIRETAESSEEIDDSSESVDSRRLVSSSSAFKNFLKNLNKLDSAKRDIPCRPEVYF